MGIAPYQQLIDMVGEACKDATKQNINIILGTDLNAQLGDEETSGAFSAVGRHGLGPQNSRGQWAASWASSLHLKAVNTYFRKRTEKLITYTDPQGRTKQLDYLLVDRTFFRRCRNSESNNLLDLGSDHRSLLSTFEDGNGARTKMGGANKSCNDSAWPPSDLGQICGTP